MLRNRAETEGSHEDTATRVTVRQLAGLDFFTGLPEWALIQLAESATERRLPRNALVVRQNDEARAVYVLLDGTVQILVDFEGVGDLLMGVQREPGTLIGWSAFRAPYRYTDSVRCEEPSRLLRLPRATFEDIFEADPYLGYLILKRVAATVDVRLEGAVALLDKPIGEDQGGIK